MTKKRGFEESHTNEFSKRAESYGQYNIIQKKVVKKLISSIDSRPKKILDLGCGRGGVYELIDWQIDSFTGIDKADRMCALHPENKKISLIRHDFEDKDLLETLGKFDMIISSSALQWATDLEKLLENLSNMTNQIAFSIFCDKTFKTIYDMTDMKTFLPSSEELLNTLQKHFIFTHEIKLYKLFFDNNISKFRYIKRSGVSGGQRKLTVRETRQLIKNYPHDYLEFEVLFVWGEVKR